jgi:hypothetical protein
MNHHFFRQFGMIKPAVVVGLLWLAIVLTSVTGSTVYADSQDRKDKQRPFDGDAQKQFAPGNSSQISNRRAATLVKQRYANARILGVSRMSEQGGPPMFRVRTLSPEGVVKSVFVDGRSGEVFE